MANVNITNAIKSSEARASLDSKYGPYASVAAAHAALGEEGADVVAVGLTVGIITGENQITEYWYQGGTTQAHLVPKLASSEPSGSTPAPAPSEPTTVVSFSDFVSGGIANGSVNDAAGGLRSFYPLNPDDIEGVSCTGSFKVGLFGSSFNQLSLDEVAGGGSWSNPHTATARYLMIFKSSSDSDPATLTVKSTSKPLFLSQVDFCGSNLFTLFTTGQLSPDPGFLDASKWARNGDASVSSMVSNSANADTFGRAVRINKPGGATTWLGYLCNSQLSVIPEHAYLVAFRARMDSFAKPNDDAFNFNRQGLDVFLSGMSTKRNTVTEVTDGYVSVLDVVMVPANESQTLSVSLSVGATLNSSRWSDIIDGYLGRCDVIDLEGLTSMPTVKQLQWAYRVFVACLHASSFDELRSIVREKDDVPVYVPAGQARRLFVNEAKRYLNELGITDCVYANPAGCVGEEGANQFTAAGLAKASVQVLTHPDLLRRIACRRFDQTVVRGKTSFVKHLSGTYMGGYEYNTNANESVGTTPLGEAYDIVVAKTGSYYGGGHDDSAFVCIVRSKEYPGRLIIAACHQPAYQGVTPSVPMSRTYEDIINVIDQLEGKSGAATPVSDFAVAGYVPDGVASCRYIDLFDYKKGDDSSSKWNTASTIKLFTTVVLDNWMKPGDMIEYTPDCVLPSGSSGFRKEIGDRFSFEDLSISAMLLSDNSMIYAMAKEAGRKIALSRLNYYYID